jgi:16S rRNA (uracil1498-N3)-methyltransferase
MGDAMHRFFIPPSAMTPDRVLLTGTVVHQLRDVLRMQPGTHIVVLDNSGWEYEVELTEVNRERAEGVVLVRRLVETEPRTKISLYQALLKGERFEFALQKGTELGVVEFVPTVAARCVLQHLDVSAQRVDRWERIIQEAAEQAHRGRLPRLQPATLLAEACKRMVRAGPALMLYEGTTTAGLSVPRHNIVDKRGTGLRDVLRDLGDAARPAFNVSVLVGPEGGFTDEEAALAEHYGVRLAGLGPRILRAETAGLVAAAAILYALGDLDPQPSAVSIQRSA